MHPAKPRSKQPVRMTLLTCLAALAAVSGLCAAGSPASVATRAATPATRAATPTCATSQLVIWLNTPGSGAAGSVYYDLQLTNLGSRSCSLRGYPGVSAVNLRGHQLGRGAGRDGYQQATTVTLAHGDTATAVLRITEAGVLPPSTCREVIAAGLRVYPPDRTTAKLVPFPFQACSGRAASNMTVSRVGPFKEE